MVAAGRHDTILRELELRGSLSTVAFATRLGVTGMTLRRDLVELERRGLLVRVHGGAISLAVAREQEESGDHLSVRQVSRPVATIGMIVPTTDYYFPEVIRGASQAAREHNCRLIVGATNYSPDEELRQARRLISGGVDALMVTPHGSLGESSEFRRYLESLDVPVVLVERGVDDRISTQLEWVRSDHVRGAELATQHLVEQGHLRIALAARPAATVAGLHEGFGRVMDRLGADAHVLRRDLSVPRSGENTTIDELDTLVEDCLADGITAAIVLGDADSMAFTDRLIEAGVRIPDDFAVVAYDDEISALAAVPLTAVAPPKRELGHAALRLCMDRLRQSEAAPHTIVRMILLPTLVVRGSTVRDSSVH
ncbi:DeoR/GlpR family transcriptional regulator [Frigoribacterium sp. CFBP 13729]|uniref:substrate-binding domain-containing protein n=1 Tax=unclassified Frigoribacterium TaxID=2627005 RepID=UPI00177F1834|nr:DeoR/GlpR family transcriptional regulator [Frigoribacterium sp. CFBP 8766]MBD8610329.1 DeoR/GlpR family transcriptional regulator [Frigoribacterium sp. CFBP 13729]